LHDAAPRLDEQRVADDRAQLVEQVADGRLRDAQPLGGASDRLLIDGGKQQLQQPAVEIQMIESAHDMNQIRSLQLRRLAANTQIHAATCIHPLRF